MVLSTQHSEQLQQMAQQHAKSETNGMRGNILNDWCISLLDIYVYVHVALQDLMEEKKRSLEELRHELCSAAELERRSLLRQHQEEVDGLKRELREKGVQLLDMRSELRDVSKQVEEKKAALEEMKRKLDSLREEERLVREMEKAAKKESQRMKVQVTCTYTLLGLVHSSCSSGSPVS